MYNGSSAWQGDRAMYSTKIRTWKGMMHDLRDQNKIFLGIVVDKAMMDCRSAFNVSFI